MDFAPRRAPPPSLPGPALGVGVCVWVIFRAGQPPPPRPVPRTHVRRRKTREFPPRGPALRAARAQPLPPQRHCGCRGFLPYMVMAALAAAGADWRGRGRGAASARPLTLERPRPAIPGTPRDPPTEPGGGGRPSGSPRGREVCGDPGGCTPRPLHPFILLHPPVRSSSQGRCS